MGAGSALHNFVGIKKQDIELSRATAADHCGDLRQGQLGLPASGGIEDAIPPEETVEKWNQNCNSGKVP
jgi:hypothetical protein